MYITLKKMRVGRLSGRERNMDAVRNRGPYAVGPWAGFGNSSETWRHGDYGDGGGGEVAELFKVYPLPVR